MTAGMRAVWALALMLLSLAAPAPARAQPMSAIRLAHLSPDAPRMDLVVDRQLFLRDIEYGQVSPYRSLPAGQHEISVYPHRLPASNEGEDPVLTLEPITMLVELGDNGYYTLAVSGFYGAPPGEASTGALAVSVNPQGASVRVTGPRGFSRSLEGEAALSELEPGEYNVQVSAPGYSPSTFAVTVREGETATISISLQEGENGVAETETAVSGDGTSGWRPVELHAFRDDLSDAPPPGGSRVRLVHLSPTTQAVDLLAFPVDGGEPIELARGLSFPNASTFARLPGSEYTLQLRLAGTAGILSDSSVVTIEPGGSYSLFLVRETEDNFLRLVPTADAILSVRP